MNDACSALRELHPRAVEAAATYLIRQSNRLALGQAQADLAMRTRLPETHAKKALDFLALTGFAEKARDSNKKIFVRAVDPSGSEVQNGLARRCLAFADRQGVLEAFAPALEYSEVTRSLQVNPLLVPWEYRGLRDLLRSLGVLARDSRRPTKWSIEGSYSYWFLRAAKRITAESATGSGTMAPEDLRAIHSRQSEVGEEAELWVLEYERERLGEHPFLSRIDHVAARNVAAGYDIASFSSTSSLVFDRFIEVKSYSEHPQFHWSKQEIEVARRLKTRYVLFLVDRARLGEAKSLIEISNPYNYFFEHPTNYWRHEPTEYRFALLR